MQADYAWRKLTRFRCDKKDNAMRRTVASVLTLASLSIAICSLPASAAVTASGPSGFSLKVEVPVAAPPEEAFARFLRIGQWWNSEHSYSGDAATNMTLDANPGGCFCEKLPNGGFVKHMDVVFSAPGKLLRLQGGLGPLQDIGASGVMSFTFKADGSDGKATKVTLTYNVSGFVPGKGLGELAPAVEGVLSEQMARYKRFVEGAKP